MAKKPNQKLRLLYLMKILSEQTDENHALTVKELSDRLEKYEIPVERKTLYDDIEQLRAYGMDIERIRVGQAHQYYVANRRLSWLNLSCSWMLFSPRSLLPIENRQSS